MIAPTALVAIELRRVQSDPVTDKTLRSSLVDHLLGRSHNVIGTALIAGSASKLAGIAIAIPVSAIVMTTTGEDATRGFSGQVQSIDENWLLTALVIAPIFESLILVLILWLARRALKLARTPAAVIAAVAMVPLHGLAFFSLTVFPTFALQAIILTRWQDRKRYVIGYTAVAATHFVHNLIAVMLAATLQ